MSSSSPFRLWRTLLIYGSVALVLLIALALTTIRLLLPQAEQYRARVEQEVSRYLGQPVRIARLDARLSMLSPTLVLDDVQLLDRAGKRTIATVGEIRISLAPLDSLRQWRAVLDEVTVVGPSLTVVRRADGSFRIQGLALRDDEQSDPEAVGRWILAQHHLRLRDSHLVWREEQSGRSFTFNGAALELHNDGDRHQLDGQMKLPGTLGGDLRLDVDMEGDPLAAGGLHGKFYFSAQKVRPAGLLQLYPVEGITPGGGELSAQIWGEWQQARLIAAQGRVQGERLVFSSGDRSETLSQLACRFNWQRETGGWRMDVEDLVLARAGRVWTPSRLRVDFSTWSNGERAYTLQASFLRIEDLVAIAELVPARGEWQRKLAQWSPRGDLSDVHLDFGPKEGWRGGATFTDFTVRATASTPGLSGFDGYAYYLEGQAGVRFATRNAQLNFPNLFRSPLAVKSLTGEMQAQRDGDGWRINSSGLALGNDDIKLRAALTLTLPDKGVPFVELTGDFHDGNATTVPRYIPARIMSGDTVAWLDRAFKSGRVVQGGVLLRGRLDQFPFDHGEGRFEVAFDAANVGLDYVPDWPPFTNINGKVIFDGRSMRVEAREAQLLGSRVTDTTVAIPDLVTATLEIDGHVDGELAHLFDYLRVTGLAGQFGDALGRFNAGGPYRLDLQIEKPLTEDWKPGAARGAVVFDGARLRVARGVELSDVRGTLRFTQDRYLSNKITARLFGAPASLRVAPLDGGSFTRVSMEGTVESESLRHTLNLPLLSHLRGRAPWEAQLLLPHQEGKECLLRLRAPLANLAIDLPEPLGKRVGEARELSATAWFTGPRAREMEFALGDRFASAVALSPEGALARAAFHFGASMPKLPDEPGILISGRLPQFSPQAWAALMSEASVKEITPKRESAPPLPVRIDMDELGILSSSEPKGTGASKADTSMSGRPLPALNVRIGDLHYDNLRLGTFTLKTENQPGKVFFKGLSLTAPAFSVTGTGEWQRGAKPRSNVDLKITGKDLGVAAQHLGVASVFNKGSFDLRSQLAWNGNPEEFDVGRMEGTLQVKLKDGTLTEVKPGAGRLLGLFSLQALPQRLTLDFRDLFDKGVRFRTVEGNFKFKDGDAFSEDLYMNSLPAAVFVTGRTGLLKRDFDQTVTVVPDVSGNLPVAGLALGPQVGAAMFIVQQLFHKKIDEASKFKYTVTGSWDNPVVQRVSKKR